MQTPCGVGEVFFSLCKSVDSSASLRAWLCYKYDQLALAELDIQPGDYLVPEAFALDYLVVSFLSKWKGLKTGLDLQAEGLRRFTSGEESCRMTNQRLIKGRAEPIKAHVASVIYTARRKIARLLGPLPAYDTLQYGWGPGATADLSRRAAFVDTKMCKLPLSVSRRALPVARQVISADLHWSAAILNVNPDVIVGPFCWLPSVFSITEECEVTTVDKNAKTHRVIAMEPTLNGYLQKGFGHFFRQRLKRVGIDLRKQENNQVAASQAYQLGLATLDLKAASDTVSKELVYELLPLEWADALDSLRSHKARLPSGEVISLEKFSSMGNGFTFELESLIFWAVADSCREAPDDSSPSDELLSRRASEHDPLNLCNRVLVYGDDIVCPSEVAPLITETLAYLGFELNHSKSYVQGNFYESCGNHYFKGYNVTPIYQKDPIEDSFDCLRMGNRIIRWAFRLGGGQHLHWAARNAWHQTRRIPVATRTLDLQLPLGAEGDDGWVVPATYFHARSQDPNRGLRCRVAVFSTRVIPGNSEALLAYALSRNAIAGSYQPCLQGEPDRASFDNWDRGDDIPLPPSKTDWTVGGRFLMPSGEFGLDW